MYATHFHLMLMHFPIVGIIIGIGILVYGLVIKNDMVKKIALTIFIIMGIFTIPIYFTGEWSKLIVEKLPGISDDFIKSHEAMSIKTIFLTGILLLLSIINLIGIKRQMVFIKAFTVITLVVSLIASGFLIRAANLGGKIRHSEIVEQHLN
jgi:uncharacterized membrane protein